MAHFQDVRKVFAAEM